MARLAPGHPDTFERPLLPDDECVSLEQLAYETSAQALGQQEGLLSDLPVGGPGLC